MSLSKLKKLLTENLTKSNKAIDIKRKIEDFSNKIHTFNSSVVINFDKNTYKELNEIIKKLDKLANEIKWE